MEPVKLLVMASTLLVGTVQEDCVVERAFWLRNVGTEPMRIAHVWTSCGCTTAAYDESLWVEGGDSACVVLRFDPKGKGGEFLESARVQVVSDADTVWQNLYMEGEVVPSEEHVQKAYPVRVGHLRLSTDLLDFGELKRGEQRTMQIAVQDKSPVSVILVADERVGWGGQVMTRMVEVEGTQVKVTMKVMVTDSTVVGENSPSLLTERRLPVGTSALTLRNVGKNTLIIHRIYSEKGDLLSEDTPIDRSPLVLPIPSKHLEGEGDLVLTIISNDPRHLRMTVRVKR